MGYFLSADYGLNSEGSFLQLIVVWAVKVFSATYCSKSSGCFLSADYGFCSKGSIRQLIAIWAVKMFSANLLQSKLWWYFLTSNYGLSIEDSFRQLITVWAVKVFLATYSSQSSEVLSLSRLRSEEWVWFPLADCSLSSEGVFDNLLQSRLWGNFCQPITVWVVRVLSVSWLQFEQLRCFWQLIAVKVVGYFLTADYVWVVSVVSTSWL